MKIRERVLFGLAVALCPFVEAVIVVGSGPDSSYFLIESPRIGTREYEIRYTYDAGNTLGGSDLLNLIAGADPQISFVIFDFGSAAQPNEFLNSVIFEGVAEVNDFSAGGTSWAQWVAGGQAGAENTSPFNPDPRALPSESWTFGSGLSNPYRVIEPGSSDALVFGRGEPSLAPVPEPGTVALALVASLALVRRRRS